MGIAVHTEIENVQLWRGRRRRVSVWRRPARRAEAPLRADGREREKETASGKNGGATVS